MEHCHRSYAAIGNLLAHARHIADGARQRLANWLVKSAVPVLAITISLLVFALLLAHAMIAANPRVSAKFGSEPNQIEELPFSTDQFFGSTHPGGE